MGLVDPTPQIGGWLGARGTKMVPFKYVLLASYYLPIVTKALSLTVSQNSATLQTDRRMDRLIDIQISIAVDLMLRVDALASVAKIILENLTSFSFWGFRPT